MTAYKRFTQAITVDAAAHASGDVYFQPFDIAITSRGFRGSRPAILRTVIAVLEGAVAGNFQLGVLSDAPADSAANNAAADYTEGELQKVIGAVTFATADFVDQGAALVATKYPNMPLIADDEQNISIIGISTGTDDFVATTHTLIFVVEYPDVND